MGEEVTEAPAKRKKASYVGVPAIFKLSLACRHLNDAYGDDGFGCYLVGSSLERPDWRDVDVVFIMSDEAFKREFPATDLLHFELDAKWLIHTVALSDWLMAQTGLPIDFKIQPQSWANERHSKCRHALGLRVGKD